MRKTCAAVIVAAGTAQRMQGIDKVLAQIGGVPMLLRAARVFERSDCIDTIVIVTRAELIESVRALCSEITKLSAVVEGGDSRTASVLCGLDEADTDFVAIHDGARPLVTDEIIRAAVSAAMECGAAAPAIPVRDTMKVAQNGFVESTPERSTLFAVQTPQVFDTLRIRSALVAAGEDLTDDCAAAERAGLRVRLTAGSEENLKVTTPLDLTFAEAILKRREDA